MTAVPGEFFRSCIVQRDPVGQSVVYHGYFGPGDANTGLAAQGVQAFVDAIGPEGSGLLVEGPGPVGRPKGMPVSFFGLYAGDATDELSSGVLFALAQAPEPFHKDVTSTISLDWTLTVSGKLS